VGGECAEFEVLTFLSRSDPPDADHAVLARRRPAAGRRADPQRPLHPAVPPVWLDRPLVRRRPLPGRRADRLDPQPGHGPAEEGARRADPAVADNARCIRPEGAGFYGHNCADDAAADAALAAMTIPGRSVRLQWMREQEHGWEPMGRAMTIDLAAALGTAGRIAS
jgi:hypothetical protein